MTSGRFGLNNGSQPRKRCKTFPTFCITPAWLLDCLNDELTILKHITASPKTFVILELLRRFPQQQAFVRRWLLLSCLLSVIYWCQWYAAKIAWWFSCVFIVVWVYHLIRRVTGTERFHWLRKWTGFFFFFLLGNSVSGTKWWMLFSSNQFVPQRLHATAAALPVLP